MLRNDLNDFLKKAVKDRDRTATSTVRLILAALKDRDIAARERGLVDGIEEPEILEMLQKMVRQRREAMEMYEKGGRLDLKQKEAEEIAVIEGFLPAPVSEEEMGPIIDSTIQETEARTIKDMGRVMSALKASYMGRMDFGKASQQVKARLS